MEIERTLTHCVAHVIVRVVTGGANSHALAVKVGSAMGGGHVDIKQDSMDAEEVPMNWATALVVKPSTRVTAHFVSDEPNASPPHTIALTYELS